MTNRVMSGFNNDVLETFDIMRISRRQKLVGSASVLGNIVTNDYDLNEIFEEVKANKMDSLTRLYFMFLWKFEKIYNSTNLWIVDFKCGEYDTEPIRWNIDDMGNGYKTINKKKIMFVDCLTQSNTKTKLDVVLLLNNRFVEISELYYIKVNNKSNFNPNDFKRGTVINQLKDDMNTLIDEKNYFKALKREYRILSILGKNKKRQQVLADLFNGVCGYLYYSISQSNTLIQMKQQTFKPVDDAIYLSVQQNIKDDIGKIINYKYGISHLNRDIGIKSIETIIKYLTKVLNQELGFDKPTKA